MSNTHPTPQQGTSRSADRSTAAVLLAAGPGSRYIGSTHKLLAKHDGQTVLHHSLEAAIEAELDEVIVVQGAVDLSAHVPSRVTLLHNEQWADGQASSLRAAVGYAQSRGHGAIVVGLADNPGVTAQTWSKLAEVDSDLASARYDGELGFPVRLSASMWASLPVSGDEALRSLMKQRPDLVRPVPVEGSPNDINTEQDLRRWS